MKALIQLIKKKFWNPGSGSNIQSLKQAVHHIPPKAIEYIGRYREIHSDPVNLLVNRVPGAGIYSGDYVVLHNGNIVKYKGNLSYYSKFSEILVTNRGVHEPLEEYVFQQVLSNIKLSDCKEHCMLELGSYWAHYSMWFLQNFPNGSAIMVEPDKQNLKVGQMNFSINNYQGEFINDFVGCNPSAFTVDKFMANKNSLTLLHSDIQGHEVEMLKGAYSSFKDQKILHVFISTHSDQLHEESLEILSDYGMKICVSSNHSSHSTSCDGLIYACHPDKVDINFPAFIGREEIALKSVDAKANLTNYIASIAESR